VSNVFEKMKNNNLI